MADPFIISCLAIALCAGTISIVLWIGDGRWAAQNDGKD